MSIESKKLDRVPAKQAMQNTIERAAETFQWLKKIQEEFEEKSAQN